MEGKLKLGKKTGSEEDNRLLGPSPPKIGIKLISMGRLRGTLVLQDAAES